MLDVGTRGCAVFVLRAGQAFSPVRMIDGIVNKYPRGFHRLACFFDCKVSGLIKIDAIESGFASETQSFGKREFLAIDLFSNHPELHGEQNLFPDGGRDYFACARLVFFGAAGKDRLWGLVGLR